MISKVISGGQSGVDRAALDFCLENGIKCGGWCPKGRLAEDGIIPAEYPLTETDSADHRERTIRNVLESDATLIIIDENGMDEGTKFTVQQITGAEKVYFLHDLSEQTFGVKTVGEWLVKHEIRVLNIAGPRESLSPGIYEMTLNFLNDLYRHVISLR